MDKPTPSTSSTVVLVGAHQPRSTDMSSSAEVTRVTRLLLESVETAFFLSNIYLEEYGAAKIFDIANQIMPTAFVYNTGYWAFYCNQYQHSICVCNRFGMRCVHKRNDLHFIDLTPLRENMQGWFSKPFPGKVFPAKTHIQVTPVFSDILRAYDVAITLILQPMDCVNGAFAISSAEHVTIYMETRYILTPQYYVSDFNKITFQPSPLGHYVCGSYFSSRDRFTMFPPSAAESSCVPRNYTIVSTDIPSIGILHGVQPMLLHRVVQSNSSVFRDVATAHIWTRTEDNSCNITLCGNSLDYVTKTAVLYTKKRNTCYGNKAKIEIAHKSYLLPVEANRNSVEDRLPAAANANTASLDNKAPSAGIFLGANYDRNFPALPNRGGSNPDAIEETDIGESSTSDDSKDHSSEETLTSDEIPEMESEEVEDASAKEAEYDALTSYAARLKLYTIAEEQQNN